MNRLERLINLVAALLETDRPRSRAELQQLVPGYEGTPEAVRRAFERDKEALRNMGVPITVEPLEPGRPEQGEGYRIRREHYELPDPGLEPDELAALHLAASAVRLEGATGREAIWKLGGAPAGDEGGALMAALPGGEHLVTLFSAMSEGRSVHFTYRGEDRTVDPFGLSFANGRWYLDGHDHLRDGERRFRVDRIEPPLRLGGRHGRPAATGGGRPPPPPWRLGDAEEVEALVLVDREQAEWAVAAVGEPAVRERTPDGGVVLALQVANRDAFRSFVLGFLDHAEVLAPPDLRRDLVEWLQALRHAA